MNREPQIVIKNLTTGFPAQKGMQKVLHEEMNLSLHAGELVCILGPNGAGKSTLLKTLLAFVKPLAGQVYFNGKSISELTVRELSKTVSIVLTDSISNELLTVFDIVSTGRFPYNSITGRLTNIDYDIIERALDRVGATALSNARFGKLSDGEKQKVMIARAIAQDTPFIFLDEPVAFVDAPSRIAIMHLLHDLVASGNKGILMATHDLDTALHYADIIWLLGKNGTLNKGNPSTLVNEGLINSCFDTKEVSFDANSRRFKWTGNG